MVMSFVCPEGSLARIEKIRGQVRERPERGFHPYRFSREHTERPPKLRKAPASPGLNR